MTTPVRNVELLEKTIQHILDHPEQHDQAVWVTACGTAACFAGWACLLAGYQVDELDVNEVAWIFPKPNHVGTVARAILGITEDESDALFNPCNTPEVLQLMVKDLLNGDELRHSDDYRAS